MLFDPTRPAGCWRAVGVRRTVLGLSLSLSLAACAGPGPAPAPPAADTAAAPAATPARLSAAESLTAVTPLALPEAPAARQALEAAREAMQKRQWATMNQQAAAALDDPVLGMYGRYWLLRREVTDPTRPIPVDAVRAFVRDHAGSYLADRLTGEWIVAAARAGDYAQALQLAPVTASNASVDCSLLTARHLSGQKVNARTAMDAFQPNAACWTMLDELYERKVVGWQDVSDRLRAALEINRTGDAQRLAAVLFDGAQMSQYAALIKNPRNWLNGRAAPRNRADTELTAIALSRLARGNQRAENARYIESTWAKQMPRPEMEWVWSQFGLVAALNTELDAAEWYRRSGHSRLTDYNHAWQVRAELRQPAIDWEHVAKAIRRMSARQAEEPVWMYWYGRALRAGGNEQAAAQYFERISGQLDFYGLLATEALGRQATPPPDPLPVTAAELREVQALPGLQRAVALFRLGWRPEAVPEWNFTLRGMSDRQLRAAAELARQEHIYDRVINTSLLTRQEVDQAQRFVAPFEGKVSAQAREQSLDPAWVYGLIRQESRFIMDARSRVGASGLMQLMPDTARWVAKRLGLKDFKLSTVNDFDTNTLLGTSYLRMVKEDLDNSEVLATAGYNAGPGRPRQWRARLGAPVEGAIFAETIPFTETRLYVKHVMSNATYYAMRFTGQPQSLTARLGTVTPAARGRTPLP